MFHFRKGRRRNHELCKGRIISLCSCPRGFQSSGLASISLTVFSCARTLLTETAEWSRLSLANAIEPLSNAVLYLCDHIGVSARTCGRQELGLAVMWSHRLNASFQQVRRHFKAGTAPYRFSWCSWSKVRMSMPLICPACWGLPSLGAHPDLLGIGRKAGLPHRQQAQSRWPASIRRRGPEADHDRRAMDVRWRQQGKRCQEELDSFSAC